ncbi:MAG: GTP-binding protein [Thermoleophilia bacterium]|nr:GTP-binding protein [Thermoleophilia bacterium]
MLEKKVCMVGAPGVGKTSLVRRFVESVFSERYHSTIGVKVDKKVVAVDGRELGLVLWDLEGADELTPLSLAYFRGAAGYLLVVDGTRATTLEAARDLRDATEAQLGSLPHLVLLNKTDLPDAWAVGDGAILAGAGADVRRTSAKTGSGVGGAFLALGARLLG